MTFGAVSKLRARVSRLRRDLLAYVYDYDRGINEEIIVHVLECMGGRICDDNPAKRRWARAVAQYRCQLAMRPWFSKWGFEIASLFALPAFLIWAVLTPRNTTQDTTVDGVRLVFPSRWATSPEIFAVPGELGADTIETAQLARHALFFADTGLIVRFLTRCVKSGTPFPFQLALKCAVDLGKVRGALDGFIPSYVLVYWEFSCGLSFLTDALSRDGIAVYNVMHGDKHFYAKHAFFEVERCYCWNDWYVDVFKSEHAHADFRVFDNPAFELSEDERHWLIDHPSESIGIAAPHIATLTRETGAVKHAAKALTRAINALAEEAEVTVRPHPFYAEDFEQFRDTLSGSVRIEPADSKPARRFILEHAVIVGTVSSILLEAAHIGRQVVVLSTPVMESVESYHYLYQLPNVRTATVETLSAIIADVDRSAPLVQTVHDRARPSEQHRMP